MTDPIEVTISDGTETYVMVTKHYDGGWLFELYSVVDGIQWETYPPPVLPVQEAAPYPTPYACLEALFRAVVTELFGVKA